MRRSQAGGFCGFPRCVSRAVAAMIRVMATIGILIFLSLDAGFFCDARQTSDQLVVKDRYSNYDYAYSVRLPKGLTGSMPPAPFPNHGFEIQLSDHAILSVDASYNAAEWNSFKDAINFHLRSFKDEVGGEVSLVGQTRTVLAGLRATRFTMRPKTSASNQVREILLAFRKIPGEVGIVYEISLTTLTSRYDQDKQLVADLQRTWGLRSLPK
jgi:hypothetical protein